MKRSHIGAIFALGISTTSIGAFAQDATAESPMVIAPRAASNTAVLPANTEVLLAMNESITTKGDNLQEGSTFSLSVVHDVMLGDYVIIPAGARAMGEVTWLTSKGAFGKSGKMDIALRYVEVNGRRIPLTGTYRQEGEGNTVATVGGVIAAGVFAAFITGKSGVIPQGRELMARTKNDLPVQLVGASTAAPMIATVKPTMAVSAPASEQPAPAEPKQP
ncbi:hypothetical protein [Blastomonas fulva]|jgi:hypothetical protein|uniref:hypothetical protein n=1 Tax=Blastomonas fulva TaxID=1550728 RepID=UPI003D28B3E4